VPLAIEPYGDLFWLEPGASVRLVAKGPAGGSLHVLDVPDRIELFLWPGATGTLFQADNGAVVEEYRVPIPALPSEMSVADFVHFMNDNTARYQPADDRRIPGTYRRRI
jgi:hypothetical protein